MRGWGRVTVLVVVGLFGTVLVSCTTQSGGAAPPAAGKSGGVLLSAGAGVDCNGVPQGAGAGVVSGTVSVTRTASELDANVNLAAGVSKVYSIEVFKKGTACGSTDNPGATGVTLASDSTGSGQQTVPLSLPYRTYTGDVVGTTTGEWLVVVLDDSHSTGSGDRYVAVVPVPAVGASIAPSAGGPFQFGLSIDQGRSATNSAGAQLTLTAPPGVTQARIVNGSDPTPVAWQPFVSSMAWSLPTGDGTKTVSAQLRDSTGGVSRVVSSTIVLDTVPPAISIDSQTNGQAVSVANGDPFVLSGPASDDRSGVATVAMDVVGQSGNFAAQYAGGRWLSAAGAPTSGTFTYDVVATDNAGNTANAQVSLVVTGPSSSATTIVRQGVVTLSAAQQAALVSAAADGSSLTFQGDVRSTLGAAKTIVSDAVGTTAPSGLLRHVKSSSYDSTANQTTIVTSLADLADVYARYQQPAAATQQPPASETSPSNRCDSFAQNRTLSVKIPLPAMSTALGNAHVSANADLVGVFDLDVNIDIGWGGVDVSNVKMIGGMMLCGSATASTTSSISDVLENLKSQGIDPNTGISIEDLLASASNPSLNMSVGADVGEIETGPYVLPGPVPIEFTPTITFSGDLEGEVSLETLISGGFSAGFTAGYDHGPVFDPTVDGQITDFKTGLDSSVRAAFGGAVGVKVYEVVKSDFLTISEGIKDTFHPTWTDDRLSANGQILQIETKQCFDLGVDLGLKLSIDISFGLDFSFTLLDVTKHFNAFTYCLPFETHKTPLAPPTITTLSLPRGAIHAPYTTQLAASGEGLSWSGSGLPPGLALDQDGTISGAPTQAGTFSVNVTATDAYRNKSTATFSLSVDPLTILSTTASAVINTPASIQLSANESNLTWQLVAGTLPAGLVFNTDGSITGTANALDAGSPITVTAVNTAGDTATGVVAVSVTPPPPPPHLTGVTSIAYGYDHTCALVTGGSVYCWGYNQFGELGDPTVPDFHYSNSYSATPVLVSGITGATAISAGYSDTCALLAGGTVKCWGWNNYGEFGDGTSDFFGSATPVSVSGISGATAITSGYAHNCALVAGGAVECWGRSTYGELGDGTGADGETPVFVSGITGATAIVAGNDHTCALLTGGSVECWGQNSSGELGDGTTTTAFTPVPVSGLSGATAITASGWNAGHTCALVAGGSVECWGDNQYGELGSGPAAGSTTPVVVNGITGATAVTTGYEHTCVLMAGGSIECWGQNGSGQLGNGTTVGSTTPVQVNGITGAAAVAPGFVSTCALVGDSVQCWGYNNYGELGNGTTAGSLTPVYVAPP
jgi:alpha-tubulin suppressor-like RCC1 family protein